ncbi:MAG TPA: hypothetical protein VG032_06825 [Acidimicrobiales bacterium]|nr:hypothetical protein [Acidimicrobiales bacterium]
MPTTEPTVPGAATPPGDGTPGAVPTTTAPDGGDAAATGGGSDGPVMTLRGAGVDVDVRRVAWVVVGACLLALAVTSVVLFVAGARRNAQIDQFHRHGVVVDATVSGCIGLMGGSGSNLAGYDCRATFTLDGHRYNEDLVGTTTPSIGAKVRAVTVPGDPALLATVATVSGEQASWRVFILPTALVLALGLAIVAALLVRRRRPMAR